MTGSKNEEILDENDQSYETITSTARIEALLKPVVSKVDLLVITLSNAKSQHKSTLLKVDASNNVLVLDRLTPNDGHDLLLDARQATIQISHKGADIFFTANLNDNKPEDIMPRYEFIFPGSIQYLHRRNSYRVTVRDNSEMTVEIQTNDGESFLGKLHNISADGMSIRFPAEIDLPQEKNSTEVHSIVTLPDNQELKCVFNICHSHAHKHIKDFRIGGNFQYMDKTQKRALEKFVAELQRKAQKTMVR